MPIEDCPFTDFKNGIYRPYIALKIINPHTNRSFKTIRFVLTIDYPKKYFSIKYH